MLWLIYGGKGWIGQQIIEILNELGEKTICGQTRPDNYQECFKEITQINPDRIICSIGRTYGPNCPNIDYLELPGKLKENIQDNLHAPVNLGLISNQLNIHLTYIGTGCIFEFDDSHPLNNWKINGFNEKDVPNFMGSQYSTVKGVTDQLMGQMKNVLNARIRMPISDQINHRNFITKIVNYTKVISIPNSMTVLPELLPLLIELSTKKITGTINLTNPGAITHQEILDMYTQIVDPQFKYEIMSHDELDKYVVGKRSNNYLETNILQKYFPNVNTIHTAVQKILFSMKNNIVK